MARVFAVLRALTRAFFRDQKSLGSVAGNNFFLVTALLLQNAGGFLYLLIALVLLFPLSTDPLRKIPASRLVFWPLEKRDRWMLRVVSPWVNPVSWLVAVLAIWTVRGSFTTGLWILIAGLFAAAFCLSDLPFSPYRALWRRIPNFPGRWNQLIRKNIREMLMTLDFYCALLLSIAAVIFRLTVADPPREALLALTVLIVLALSSYAQCLFGLDGDGGLLRYQLLPLRGWEILAAKDAAFLFLVIPLTLPLAPLSGTAAALIALAMGHQPAVYQPREQARGRFSSGASLLFGLAQAVLMTTAAAGVFFNSVLVVVPCLAVWAGSVAYYGRELERASRA
ncbi:MAG TPA: hypothetical protein VFQ79_12665 [Bryobacteraceae bacterium]|nr:hypothetical protein [Bryobacteraceae bacterium]